MEDFSQSRGADDLFDDDFVPIDVSEQESSQAVQVQDISLNAPQKDPSFPSRGNDPPRGPRARVRGASSKGLSKRNDLTKSKYAPQSTPTPAHQDEPKTVTEPAPEQPASAAEPSTTEELRTELSPVTVDTARVPVRAAAVRGDRTGTGGVKKPKLTEEELTQKLAAAKERSQNLSAAHARAEADAASFEERERVAQQKRAKDIVNRRAMDSEREKNRARKMAGLGRREWDSEKNEEDFRIQQHGRGRGRGGQLKPMNGTAVIDGSDPSLDDLSQYEWREDRGRGRGGRGRGRGAPRGGRGDARNGSRQPNMSAEAEFPALPASAKPANVESKKPRPVPARVLSDVLSPSAEGEGGSGSASWADQVESSEAAKA